MGGRIRGEKGSYDDRSLQRNSFCCSKQITCLTYLTCVKVNGPLPKGERDETQDASYISF